MTLGTITVQDHAVMIPMKGEAEFAGTVAEDEMRIVGGLGQSDEKPPMTPTRP